MKEVSTAAPRKVLLASIRVGGGHAALRDSFHRVLSQVDPEAHRYAPSPWDSSDRRLNAFYSATVHWFPQVNHTLFWLNDHACLVGCIPLLVPWLAREARILLRRTSPDLVVSTHFILSMVLARARTALGLDVPLVGAIPDYGIPTRGFCPPQRHLRTDYIVVMDPQTRDHLMHQRRVPAHRIHLSGLLPAAPFEDLRLDGNGRRNDPVHRRLLVAGLVDLYPQLGSLDPARPTVLFLGGSAWTARTLPVLKALRAHADFLSTVNVIVVCGGDASFFSHVRRRFPFIAFGFVPSHVMAVLMSLADVPVLGSLAPATMHELLERRCGPLLLFHFIPGTETQHVDYIHGHGIGRYEPRTAAMVDLLMQFTGFREACPDLAALSRAFPQRARAIRAEHRSRALGFADFLDGVSSSRESTGIQGRHP